MRSVSDEHDSGKRQQPAGSLPIRPTPAQQSRPNCESPDDTQQNPSPPPSGVDRSANERLQPQRASRYGNERPASPNDAHNIHYGRKVRLQAITHTHMIGRRTKTCSHDGSATPVVVRWLIQRNIVTDPQARAPRADATEPGRVRLRSVRRRDGANRRAPHRTMGKPSATGTRSDDQICRLTRGSN